MADDRAKDWWHFQFEPAAWLGDAGVQSLSWTDQGIWFRLLLAMHQSPRRGVLLFATGAAMDGDAIASLLRTTLAEWEQIRDRLLTRGVASVDEKTGALVNRKMLRDTEKRTTTAEAKRIAGAMGAAKRWGHEPPADSRPLADPLVSMGNKNNNNNKNKNNRHGAPTDKPRGTTPGNGHDGGGHDAGLPQTDPLNSVNFRAGLLLLLSTGMSDAVAKGFAGEHPLGRLAAVVVAAAGQKSPAGWTRTALEKAYVVPELDETERAKILKTLDDLPRLELPETAKGGRRAGETPDQYVERVAKMSADKLAKAREKKAAADGAKG